MQLPNGTDNVRNSPIKHDGGQDVAQLGKQDLIQLLQQAGQRIESLRSSQRLQQSLYEIADLAGGSRDMQDMLRRIHAIIGELMYAENCYIVLYDEFRQKIRFLYFIDKLDSFINDPAADLDFDKADANLRTLSGGMQRRVLVAQALVHKPPVIVLDEPTAGVDVELRQGLWRFIKELNRDGHTIVLTTHYLDEAEALCSRVAMLKQGNIVALDSIRNLINGISGCSVRLRLLPDTLPPALQPLLSRREEEYYILALEEYSQLEHVMAVLRIAGSQVLEMQVFQPDLEEVFVKIMGDVEIRDAAAVPIT